MRLLIDENVPASISAFLAERGHEVILSSEAFGKSTPDQVIALIGGREGAIVVTWNVRHFKQFASRAPVGARQAIRNLGMIAFRCDESHGLRRTQELIEWIEFEYDQVQKRPDKRMIVYITESRFTLER